MTDDEFAKRLDELGEKAEQIREWIKSSPSFCFEPRYYMKCWLRWLGLSLLEVIPGGVSEEDIVIAKSTLKKLTGSARDINRLIEIKCSWEYLWLSDLIEAWEAIH